MADTCNCTLLLKEYVDWKMARHLDAHMCEDHGDENACMVVDQHSTNLARYMAKMKDCGCMPKEIKLEE